MDGDDHGTEARRGKGRPRKDTAPDGLEGVRRAVALEVIAELIEEWTGRRVPTRELVDELLARLREE
jgi:hypothetical protein